MKGHQDIIATLNHLLAGELTAVDQYLIHGEMYADMGYKALADKALHESEHERQHAQQMIQRILFLEGTPDLSKREPLTSGSHPEAMLTADLQLEYAVTGKLKTAVALCEKHQDFVTRDLLVKQLDDTEMDHAYYLEKQLRLFKALGAANYLQSQMS